jgi:hypothetical protein
VYKTGYDFFKNKNAQKPENTRWDRGNIDPEILKSMTSSPSIKKSLLQPIPGA